MNIVVLCGGLSAERDVSVSSGTRITKALIDRGHRAIMMDLFYGYVMPYNSPSDVFEQAEELIEFIVPETVPDVDMPSAAADSRIGANVIEICRAADIVFLALHGDDGENGKLQAVFDMAGIKYTGSGYLGSALAMDKAVTKKLLSASGILTPEGISIRYDAKPYKEIGFPCVVKPCSGGSSVGASIVRVREDYITALEEGFKYGGEVVVERYIEGREFTVGVMGGKAMPVIELRPREGFYDYRNKYQAGLTEELCPAPISSEETERLQNTALCAFAALKIDVYARMDCIMDKAGDIYCLELNTLPGMTATSLIPQMGENMGMGYGELCERIIALSMEKYK